MTNGGVLFNRRLSCSDSLSRSRKFCGPLVLWGTEDFLDAQNVQCTHEGYEDQEEK